MYLQEFIGLRFKALFISHINKCLVFSLLLINLSCAGYQIVENKNPFAKFNVTELTIPMFVNKTSYANLNSIFTSAVYLQLSKYSDLKLYTGSPDRGSAVLVGIIGQGEAGVDENLKIISKKFISGTGNLLQSIGSREPFYVTTEYSGQLYLYLILIKNPLIDGGKVEEDFPEVVFQQRINLGYQLTNVLKSNLSPDDGGVVNYSNNMGNLKLKMREVAKTAALNLERIIEY